MNEKINIDPGAAQVLNELHRAGYKAYLVGGCVRDSLAGRTPHDWDICTSARPEQTMALWGKALHPHRAAARHRHRPAGRGLL